MADNDNYYDDILFYGVNNQQDLWRQSPFSPPTDVYLYNTNLGDVGAGVNDPSAQFHVAGSIRAQTQTQSEDGYCDITRADCLQPEFLGGTTTSCGPGEVVQSIENNTTVCVPLFTAPVSFDCASQGGGFVTSFSNLGNIVCAFP